MSKRVLFLTPIRPTPRYLSSSGASLNSRDYTGRITPRRRKGVSRLEST